MMCMRESNHKIKNHALYAFNNDISALQSGNLNQVNNLSNYLAIMTMEVNDVEMKGLKSTISGGTEYISLTIKQMTELLDNNVISFVEVLPRFVWKEYRKKYKELVNS
jgi:hypothetical protein